MRDEAVIPILRSRGDIFHVYPSYGQAHLTDDVECWCIPSVEEYQNGNKLIVHREQN